MAERAGALLARGETSAAIDLYESLADKGYLHPDASFNRGMAYLKRVEGRSERAGDLGRAAAAMEETLRLAPNDAEADRVLGKIRAEVTRRRAKGGTATSDVRPTLDRLVAGLFPARTWTWAAVATSVLFGIGLFLSWLTRQWRSTGRAAAGTATPLLGPAHHTPVHPLRVTALVLLPVSAVVLCALVPIAMHARELERTTKPGVVVTTEVYLTGDDGRALGKDPVPEAALVEVGEQRSGLVHVRWGASEGWAPSGAVRLLP